MSTSFAFDVFLSHSSKDKEVVRDLAARLDRDGLRVWLDERELKAGDSIPAKIDEGLENSRVLVLCMSAYAFGSDWAQLESQTFRFRDPMNKERRFIPLRLDNSPIKGSLAQFLYIDWRSSGKADEYPKLLEACTTEQHTSIDMTTADTGWRVPTPGDVISDRTTRDDFNSKTKDILARRVGVRCSNPVCRKDTSGPQSDANKAINIGVAAHIAAASADGPRYDPTMSRAERSSIGNGVWLCQNCAKLVDNDVTRYTVGVLHHWKAQAETEALRRIEATPAFTIEGATAHELSSDMGLLRQVQRTTLYGRYGGIEVDVKARALNAQHLSLFVGRDLEVAQLTRYLRDSDGTWLVVSGPAGFGKSCLLANWSQQLTTSFVVYHQFSNRTDLTRSTTAALRNLLRQLCIYYTTPLDMPLDVYGLRDVIYGLIADHKAFADEPLVVVIDALDEAEFDFPPPFPTPLPKGVSVVVSCRGAAGEPPSYVREWIPNAKLFHLDRLSKESLRSWVAEVGAGALRQFSSDESFMAELESKTHGFPLYVRFLLEELVAVAPRFETVHEYLSRQPGEFRRYVEQQFEMLARTTQVTNYRCLFELLTVTIGGLPESDLCALTTLNAWGLHPLPWEVGRWLHIEKLDGGGQSYSFSHPLLAEQFQQILKDRSTQARERLIDYCLKWQTTNSLYALQYLPTHCSDAGLESSTYELARSSEFMTAQFNAFPYRPELMISTIQAALYLAARKHDPTRVAEFLLARGYRTYELKHTSPLATLSQGDPRTAWQLSLIQTAPHSIIWRLLICWHILEEGHPNPA